MATRNASIAGMTTLSRKHTYSAWAMISAKTSLLDSARNFD
jgi:hypothetical protein